MKSIMRVKFKVAWRNYRVGQIIEPGGLLGGWLIQNGFAVPYSDELNVADKLQTRVKQKVNRRRKKNSKIRRHA